MCEKIIINMTSLSFFYQNKIRRDFFLKNSCIHPYQIPSLEKIILSVNLEQDALVKKKLMISMLALELIGQQKSKLTRCKKSIAGFKIRKGDPLGCKITLRKKNMFFFLLICVYLIFPNMRDWNGLAYRCSNRIFLGQKVEKYSLSFGCEEFLLFPQLQQNYLLFQYFKGFNVVMVLSITERILLQSFLTSFRIPLIK